MSGPGLARATTAVLTPQAEIDTLREENANLRAERVALLVAIADRDEKIATLQAMLRRAHTETP